MILILHIQANLEGIFLKHRMCMRYGVWVVFVAATFTVALFFIIRRLSDLRLHSAALLLYCSIAL